MKEYIQQASSPKASEQINKWRHTLEPVKQHIYIYSHTYRPIIFPLRSSDLWFCYRFLVNLFMSPWVLISYVGAMASNQSPLSSMASYRTNSLNRALTFNDEGKLVPEPTTMLPDIRSIRDLPGRKWSSPKSRTPSVPVTFFEREGHDSYKDVANGHSYYLLNTIRPSYRSVNCRLKTWLESAFILNHF